MRAEHGRRFRKLRRESPEAPHVRRVGKILAPQKPSVEEVDRGLRRLVSQALVSVGRKARGEGPAARVGKRNAVVAAVREAGEAVVDEVFRRHAPDSLVVAVNSSHGAVRHRAVDVHDRAVRPPQPCEHPGAHDSRDERIVALEPNGAVAVEHAERPVAALKRIRGNALAEGAPVAPVPVCDYTHPHRKRPQARGHAL